MILSLRLIASRVLKHGKTAPDSTGGTCSAPPDPIAGGEGLPAPPQEPHPRGQPFGPRFPPLPQIAILDPRLL